MDMCKLLNSFMHSIFMGNKTNCARRNVFCLMKVDAAKLVLMFINRLCYPVNKGELL